MTDQSAEYRDGLVSVLKEAGQIRTASVEAAFRVVPRHRFVPNVTVAQAYRDCPYPIKIHAGVVISSSSQPAIMAEMLERLSPNRNERILEIGAGSGYNAALLAELVGPNGVVSTIDLDEDILQAAARHLRDAGYPHVRTLCVDGAGGDPANAPFDAIIATVAVGDIPPAWIAQLRVGGRLIVPIALGLAQRVVTFERGHEYLKSTSVVGGEFMAFRGSSSAASIGELSTLGDPAIRLRTLRGHAVNCDALTRAFHGEYLDLESPIEVTLEDLWGSLDLWLSIHEPTFCRLTAHGSAAERGLVPDSFGIGDGAGHALAATLGLCQADEIVVFALTPNGMGLRAFGKASGCVDRLARAIESWENEGRPSNARLRIRAFPKLSAHPRSAADLSNANTTQTFALPSADLVFDWT